jgi:hypothetical protein
VTREGFFAAARSMAGIAIVDQLVLRALELRAINAYGKEGD